MLEESITVRISVVVTIEPNGLSDSAMRCNSAIFDQRIIRGQGNINPIIQSGQVTFFYVSSAPVDCNEHTLNSHNSFLNPKIKCLKFVFAVFCFSNNTFLVLVCPNSAVRHMLPFLNHHKSFFQFALWQASDADYTRRKKK